MIKHSKGNWTLHPKEDYADHVVVNGSADPEDLVCVCEWEKDAPLVSAAYELYISLKLETAYREFMIGDLSYGQLEKELMKHGYIKTAFTTCRGFINEYHQNAMNKAEGRKND